MLHLASTLVVVLVLGGLYCRRTPALHLRFMLAAFIIDLLLVLYIEVTRGAVETVATQVRPFLWFHAAISLGVLALYVTMIVLGRRLLLAEAAAIPDQPGRVRRLHRHLGVTFCVLRGLN